MKQLRVIETSSSLNLLKGLAILLLEFDFCAQFSLSYSSKCLQGQNLFPAFVRLRGASDLNAAVRQGHPELKAGLKPFLMKQFSVAHDRCAMPVNSDGYLLGALAAGDSNAGTVRHILDIGTGSGVIALQMAQRFENAAVDAVEIHGPSAKQASDNFESSPFTRRMVCHHRSLQEFEAEVQYDIIVSNPPYFEGGTASSEFAVAAAKHALLLDYASLVQKAARFLKDTGSFWIIIPCDCGHRLIDVALQHGLFLNEVIRIHPKEDRPANRCIFSLSKADEGKVGERSFTLYNQDRGLPGADNRGAKQYTPEAREVLQPFLAPL